MNSPNVDITLCRTSSKQPIYSQGGTPSDSWPTDILAKRTFPDAPPVAIYFKVFLRGTRPKVLVSILSQASSLRYSCTSSTVRSDIATSDQTLGINDGTFKAVGPCTLLQALHRIRQKMFPISGLLFTSCHVPNFLVVFIL